MILDLFPGDQRRRKGTTVNRYLIALVALILLPLTLLAGNEYPEGTEWVAGRLLVNFKPSVGEIQTQERANGRLSLDNAIIDAVFARFGVTGIYRIVPDGVLAKMPAAPDAVRLVAINFSESLDVLEVRDAFLALAEVDDAEPDFILRALDTVPNDIQWNQQCDKRLMSCPEAWDFGTGTEELLAVAVDNGFWWPHPDAEANLWVNPGEDIDGDRDPYWDADYPGDVDDLNGGDDDGNGYADDLIGWDFIQSINGCAPGEDCDGQQDNDTKSVGNHGSHTLGLIGAQGNNEIGVTGVCWNIKIMASRAGYVPAGGEGLIVTSAAIATINWAVAHGVDLINMSYGGPTFSNQVNNTIQAAWASGALLCAASGNDGVSTIQYPCGYQNVICVGSTNCNDIVSGYSNYGSHVDCYAPGEGVQSLSINDGYANLQGTSMASPNALGIFGLVWSILPDLNNGQLRDIVLQNCIDILPLNPDYDSTDLGWGRVDAAKALASLLPNLTVQSATISADGDNDGRLEANETGQLSLTVSNTEGWFTATNTNVTVTSEDPNLTLSNATFTIGSLAGGQTQTLTNASATVTCGANVPYAYSTSLQIVFHLEGNVTLTRTATLRIGRAPTLVVDDDNGATYAGFYGSALAFGGYNYDDYSTTLDGSIMLSELNHYDNVIWACGNEQTNTLAQNDRDALQAYLNDGGKLLLVGQGIDEDTDVRNSTFYSDYLHVQSGGAAGSTQLSGVVGDPISDGANVVLIGGGCGGNGSQSPSVLNAVNGGVIFYTYNSNSLGGAVRYENATYKTAYFGFALEAACGAVGSAHHREVVRRVMTWFGAISDADDPISLPADFSVSPAYPNPFNPESSVQIELAHSSRVRVTLHDVLGRQVELIADRQVPAGTHTVRVNGQNLASGSYWLNVSVNNLSDTQRIILLK